MRKKLIISTMILCNTMIFAQNNDNPYAAFGYEPKVSDIAHPETELFYLRNTDKTAIVQMLVFDFENSIVHLYGTNNQMLTTLFLDKTTMARFLTRDPLEEKYYWNNPYVYCNNNSVRWIDPTGMTAEIVCPETGNRINYTPGMAVPEDASQFVSDAITGLNFLHDNPESDNNRVSDIVNAETVLSITQQTVGASSKYNPYNRTLSWDNQSIDVFDGGLQSAIVGFAHEIDHASISIPAWDEVSAYENGQSTNFTVYVNSTTNAYLAAIPGDMRYENSAMQYENFIGNMSVGGQKLSTYQRSEYIAPKITIRNTSIFSIVGR
jgi:hypothetical protein